MNMQKRSVLTVLLVLLVASFIFTLSSVSAEIGADCSISSPCDSGEFCINGACIVGGDSGNAPTATSGGSSADGVAFVSSGFDSGWMKTLRLDERWNLWVKGSSNVTSESDLTLFGETLKYLVLFIVVLAVFSAFGALDFPSNKFARLGLAAIIGILGTFAITTKELITALLSYTALTTTIIITVPVLALLGLTIMAAYKTSSIGLYASKVLWAGYSIFLFVKGLILVLLTRTFYVTNVGGKSVLNFVDSTSTSIPSYLLPFLPKMTVNGKMTLDGAGVAKMMGQADLTIAWVLLISAAIIFFFMVINSKWITMWMEKEARESMIAAKMTQSQLAAAKEKIDADAMRAAGKPV